MVLQTKKKTTYVGTPYHCPKTKNADNNINDNIYCHSYSEKLIIKYKKEQKQN